MRIIIFLIIGMTIVWLAYRYYNNVEEPRYESNFNKLLSAKQNNSIEHIKVNNVGENVTFDKYNFTIKSVVVQVIPKDNRQSKNIVSTPMHKNDGKRIITVEIELDGVLHKIKLEGGIDNYDNMYSSNVELDRIGTEFHAILYNISIHQIYVNDFDENWKDLILSINKYVENKKIPLEKSAQVQPIRTNLLNPISEVLYDDNGHAYRTPYRTKVDNYGVIFKANLDNIGREIENIRQTIKEDNKRKLLQN